MNNITRYRKLEGDPDPEKLRQERAKRTRSLLESSEGAESDPDAWFESVFGGSHGEIEVMSDIEVTETFGGLILEGGDEIEVPDDWLYSDFEDKPPPENDPPMPETEDEFQAAYKALLKQYGIAQSGTSEPSDDDPSAKTRTII